jgi:hypothetical protein
VPTGFKSAIDGKEFAVSTKELRKRFAADIGSRHITILCHTQP